MHLDPEGLGNPALQILPAPAHHPVLLRVRPGLDPSPEVRHLGRRKARNPHAFPAVGQPRQTFGIVAVNPFGGETVPRKVS